MTRAPLGKRFESVLVRDVNGREGKSRFRVMGSGIQRPPLEAPLTNSIVRSIRESGVSIREFSVESPANGASYHLEASFLDGGLKAVTGNYLMYPRGAWIEGEDAAAWVAHLLGLKPPAARQHLHPPRASVALRNAYTATDYVVLSAQEFHIRIGARLSPELQALMTEKGCRTAALLTAWNPFSSPLPDDSNRLRQLQLLHDLRAEGVDWVSAEGRDPKGTWQAETSALAFGLDAGVSRRLMGRYQQHAIVWLSIDEPAYLWHLED